MKHPLETVLLSCLCLASSPAGGETAQTKDTPREFPRIESLQQWAQRAESIRQQVLVSAGLWPMPDKTPLRAQISGRIERDGYSVEKVLIQTCPGFYLGGNLYRPLNHGPGPFPAILNPHGHWEIGRLIDTDNSSVPGRCINFARQGMIAFAYDMVGYNDTHFPLAPTNALGQSPHDFAARDHAALLWNISLMGLQTWDSVRALDFLESLPDVDKSRIACTGASGGGTQTLFLGAIDDRLAAQAPINMVSHTMQGGCACENAPGLRVEFSNMEIAAAAAPRPQLLVSATGDWTKTTLEVEGPAIANVYRLFGAADRLRCVRFDFAHNYNRTSREAVYRWFDHWLAHQPDEPVEETPYLKDPNKDLLNFSGGQLPPDALTEQQLIQFLIRGHQSRLRALEPANGASLGKYRNIIEPAWRHTLLLDSPQGRIQAAAAREHPIHLSYFAPAKPARSTMPTMVLLVHPAGKTAYCDASGAPKGLARHLLDKNFEVAVIDGFPEMTPRDQFSVLYDCYNRTYLQERVRDLIAACAQAQAHDARPWRLVLCGEGRAGLWSLLAAPAAAAVVADCCHLDVDNDQNLLAPDLFCPGIRNIDSFTGAAILASPHPLLLHNAAKDFPTGRLRLAYQIQRAKKKLRIESRLFKDNDLVSWLGRLPR